MNWRLIFALSLFGLAMGVATVFVVPSNVEPIVWLAIFIACAVIIAKRAPGKFFLHGLCVSLVNSVWITAAHVLLFDSYIATHAREAEMTRSMPLAPRVMMILTGPVVGLVSGLVLGLFAFVAGKILRRPAAAV
jgi:hypothetical protein